MNMQEHFFGIVEDRNDPLKIGRVRVRIYGLHTDDKQLIASPDLPWAQVLLPTTSSGVSGIGTQHGLVEGSTVYGFFRDTDTCQDPVVVGVSVGIPVDGYHETTTDVLLTRSTERGFNDPRLLTVDAYNNTSDGPNPPQDSRRPNGLTLAMDTSPKAPVSVEISYDGTGSKISEITVTENMLPWYPLYTNDSDISNLARGDVLSKSIDISKVSIPDSPAAPVYPFNKVTETESGHVFEIDDTVGAERISTYHRSGTFQEIHPDGSRVTRIVNDDYEVTCKDKTIFVGGKVNIVVLGDANLEVTGKTDITSGKTLSINAPVIKLNS